MDPETKKPLMKPEFCAKALKEAWEPKFKAVEVNDEMMDFFIDQFACNLSDINFDAGKKDFENQVAKHEWSSPGPDAIHYVFWAMNVLGAEILWAVREAIVSRKRPPPGFNLSLLGFIRNTTEDHSGYLPPRARLNRDLSS